MDSLIKAIYLSMLTVSWVSIHSNWEEGSIEVHIIKAMKLCGPMIKRDQYRDIFPEQGSSLPNHLFKFWVQEWIDPVISTLSIRPNPLQMPSQAQHTHRQSPASPQYDKVNNQD